MNTLAEMKKYEKEMVDIRRDLHRHPEVGFELYRTHDLVRNRLEEYGCFALTDVAKTGIIATYDSGRPGRTIAVRADMDALPMDDELEAEYCSKYPGAAHKCGHDAHTAMLLGAAHYIADHKDEFDGTIKLVFQPSEERNPTSGAVEILKSGELSDVDMMFGQHVEPMYPAGTAAIRYGGLYAGATAFDLTIIGKGGHGASPHLANDPIMTAAQIINDTQTILTRRTDPAEGAVLTFGSIHSGNAENVIPGEAHLKGTTRAMNRDVLMNNYKAFNKMVDSICGLNGCTYNMDHEVVMPVLMNDDAATAILEMAAVGILGRDNVVVRNCADISGEDFAYYSEQIPCSFLMLGCSNDRCRECLHHPAFDIDESILPFGASILLSAARNAAAR